MAVRKTARVRAHNPLVRIERLARLLHDLRTVAKTQADEISEAQSELLSAMEAAELDTHEWTDDDGKHKATYVQSERVSYDEAKLKSLLTPEQWGAITSTVVDKKKLEAAVAAGDIPLSTVNKASHITPSAPFVRVTY